MNRDYIIGVMLILMCLCSGVAFSEEGVALSSEPLLAQVERLRELKTSNPELYQKIVEQKKSRLKQDYEKIEQGGGERLARFKEADGKMRGERLKALREKNPEQFERIMNQRMERIERRAEKNPEQFRELLENRPELQKRFENWKSRSADAVPRGGVNRSEANPSPRDPVRLPPVDKEKVRENLRERAFQMREELIAQSDNETGAEPPTEKKVKEAQGSQGEKKNQNRSVKMDRGHAQEKVARKQFEIGKRHSALRPGEDLSGSQKKNTLAPERRNLHEQNKKVQQAGGTRQNHLSAGGKQIRLAGSAAREKQR